MRLFDALYVEDGEVTRYKPRREDRFEVRGLMEFLTGGGFKWRAPRTGRAQTDEGRSTAQQAAMVEAIPN